MRRPLSRRNSFRQRELICMRESDLRDLYHELLRQWLHHGEPPPQDMPSDWRDLAGALDREASRRGKQYSLF